MRYLHLPAALVKESTLPRPPSVNFFVFEKHVTEVGFYPKFLMPSVDLFFLFNFSFSWTLNFQAQFCVLPYIYIYVNIYLFISPFVPLF